MVCMEIVIMVLIFNRSTANNIQDRFVCCFSWYLYNSILFLNLARFSVND